MRGFCPRTRIEDFYIGDWQGPRALILWKQGESGRHCFGLECHGREEKSWEGRTAIGHWTGSGRIGGFQTLGEAKWWRCGIVEGSG